MGLRASSVRGLESRQAGLHLCNVKHLAKTSQGEWTYQRSFCFSLLNITLFLLTVSPLLSRQNRSWKCHKSLVGLFLKTPDPSLCYSITIIF